MSLHVHALPAHKPHTAVTSLPTVDVFDAIRSRRSVKQLTEPAPTSDDLRTMLEAATSAPDHRELRPWRFVVLQGSAKDVFAERVVEMFVASEPHATSGQVDKERSKLGRAPMVVVVAAVRHDDVLPHEELISATAAATQNLLLAAHALGYGAIWRTGAWAYRDDFKSELGLPTDSTIVGIVYLGTPAGDPPLPRPPASDQTVTHWQPDH